MVRLFLGVLVASILITTAAVALTDSASAEAPSPVGAHRHYIFAADGSKVYVGPNFCDIDAAVQGFAGFHHKVHLTDPGLVDVRSEGC